MELPVIEPFTGKLEDVHIYVHSMKMTLFAEEEEQEVKWTALTDVQYFNLVKNETNNGEGRQLVGDLAIIYRNQGKHFPSLLLQMLTINAYSDSDKDGASVMCKIVQYIMDWTKQYTKDNNVMDVLFLELFVMPAFHYAKDHFPKFAN